jgi:predicted nucleic acid-binding protein
MSDRVHRVVYDCVVYGQALINPRGPAAQCIEEAARKRVRLYISDFVVNEIRALPLKIRSRIITFEQTDGLADKLMQFAILVKDVPPVYTHPVDADDSGYINLALLTGSNLIVSRDRHLLGMMDNTSQWSREFLRQFPQLKILAPDTFIRLLRLEEQSKES